MILSAAAWDCMLRLVRLKPLRTFLEAPTAASSAPCYWSSSKGSTAPSSVRIVTSSF